MSFLLFIVIFIGLLITLLLSVLGQKWIDDNVLSKLTPKRLFILIIILAMMSSLMILIQGELEPDTVVVIVTPTMSTDGSISTETLLSPTLTPDSTVANTPTLPPVDDETVTPLPADTPAPLPTHTSAPLPTLTPTFSVDYFRGYTPTVESLNGYQYAFVPGSTVEQVEAFWIGVYEVTNSQFVTFMNSKLRALWQDNETFTLGMEVTSDLYTLYLSGEMLESANFVPQGKNIGLFVCNTLHSSQAGFDNIVIRESR